MHKAQVIIRMIVEARGNPAEVLKPCVQTFDLPPTTITAQRPAVLGRGFDSVRLVRRDHLDTLGLKCFVERVRVISLVTDQPSWSLTSETRRKSVSDKGDFMRRSTCRVGGAEV